MAPRGSKREDVLNADISYDMQRLFDHYNFDHIPEEKRLELFKQRNLPHVKHYKAAVKIFGGPPRRTRVIHAPPMETPIKHRLGLYHNITEFPQPPVLNGPLKPQAEPVKELTNEEKEQIAEDEKVAEYKHWFSERKKLRSNLNGLALSEGLLIRKPDKTPLEKRVQAKFQADRLWKPESPIPIELPPAPKPPPDVPAMEVPPPDGLQTLDKFLALNRMRLMDLFKLADKDKSWSLSREEFLNAVSQCEIPVPESDVDDIFIALDADLDDELSYKEINTGLNLWRKRRRELKRQGVDQEPAVENRGGSSGSQRKTSPPQEGKVSRSSFKEPLRTPSRERNKDVKSEGRSGKSTPAQLARESSKDEIATAERASKSTPVQVLPGEKSRGSTKQSVTRETISREQDSRSKKSFSREGLSQEQTVSGKETKLVGILQSREKSSLTRDGAKSSDMTLAEASDERAQAQSHQKVKVSEDNMTSIMGQSRENKSSSKNYSETLPLDSQAERLVYEDMLFQLEDTPRATLTQDTPRATFTQDTPRATITGDTPRATMTGDTPRATITQDTPRATFSEDTPRATVTAQGIGEEEERDALVESKESKRPLSTGKGSRPGSTKTSTPKPGSRSSTSTPNTLEPPDFDLRDESRAPESAEAMVDIRKHDRIVLSRNNIRRSLSREQRVTFDELPGVIKVGYKPIDDHCSESTLEGVCAGMVDQFRREKLKEYFEVKKICEESGLPFTQKTLDRVLLYPGDKPINSLRKNIVLPLGPLTNEWSQFNQPKPKKKPKKRRRGFRSMSRVSGASVGAFGTGNTSGGNGPPEACRDVKNDDDRGGSGSSKRSFITVEDVYPFASTVTPKVHKENLSSGRALITRKVDNWMTFEEYYKYTEHLAMRKGRVRNRFAHLNRSSNPDAAWPGYMLDKVRLCSDDAEYFDGMGHPIENRDSRAYEGLGTGLYNGKGHAVFRRTQQIKRAYPGYNNDLLTWPVGETGVVYGNIDEHRTVR